MPISPYPMIGGFTNYALTSTITVSNAATAGYPASNLNNSSIRLRYRTSAAGSPLRVDLDLGAVKSDIGIFWLLVTGQPTNLAFVVKADDNSSTFASPTYDSSTASPAYTAWDLSFDVPDEPDWGRPVIAIPASPVSARYVRFEFTGFSLPFGAVVAVVGPVLQIPRHGPAYTKGSVAAGILGAEQVYRERSVTFQCTRSAEAQLVRGLRRVGKIGRLVYIPRPHRPSEFLHEAILAVQQSPNFTINTLSPDPEDYRSTLQTTLIEPKE